MKNTCLIAAVILLYAFSCQAQEPSGLSLQQCVETGLANNLNVKQSELQMQTAHVLAEQAKTNLLPSIFGNATHGINQGRSIDPYTNSYINQQVNYAEYGLSGSLVLFNGLAYENNIKQNNLSYEASRMDLQQSKDELTIGIIIAYLGVLRGNDLLKANQQQANVTRNQVQRLEVLNEQGAILPAQLYDLKGQLANDEMSIINAQNMLDGARVTLAQLMNVPYDKNLTVQPLTADQVTTSYEATPDQIYETALQQLAIVKAAHLRQESSKKGLQAARGYYYPLLTLNGYLNTNYSNAAMKDILQGSSDVPSTDYVEIDGSQFPVIKSQDNFVSQKISYGDQVKNNVSSSVSLGLSIPILNGLQTRHQVQLAKIDLENATAVEQTTKTQLKQDIEQAYFNMTAAYQRYQTLKDQTEAFGESFRQGEVRFNAGAITSVDFLVVKNNFDQASTNLIIERYNYILRSKILDYYQGKALW